MEKELISKKDLLLYAKNATQSILNSLVAIKFIKADLYIVSKDIYAKLVEIDSLLLPYKKDTRRTNIYSIDTFVNILNPTNVAFTYTLTPVYKRKQIAYNGVFEQCFQKYLNTFDKNIFWVLIITHSVQVL